MMRLLLVLFVALLPGTSWGQERIFGRSSGSGDSQMSPDSTYSAVCDGSADASGALNAALASGNVLLTTRKSLVCRVASTIIIPAGVTLDMGNFSPGNPIQGSQIFCDIGVNPCVVLGSAGTNGTASIRNVAITRAGVPSADVVGLKIADGYNVTINNVVSNNHGICVQIQGHPAIGAGIGTVITGGYTSRCVDTHVDVDSFAEVKWIGGRLGQNGLGDYASNTMIRVRGGVAATAGGPNTIVFDDVQFNHGSLPARHFWEWVDLGAGGIPAIDGTQFQLTNSHVENIGAAFFFSDATWNVIQRVRIANTTFSNPTVPMWALNAGSKPSQWELVGNHYFVQTFNLAPASGFDAVNIVGGYVAGTMSLTGQVGSTVNITNLYHGASFVLDGTWGAFNSFGETWLSGSFTNNATGLISIYSAQGSQGTWMPMIAIGGSTSGIVQTLFAGSYQVSNRAIMASFAIALSSKGKNIGEVTIQGLPLAGTDDLTKGAGGGVVTLYQNLVGLTGLPIVGVQGGTTTARLRQAGPADSTALTDANLSNTTMLQGTITYFLR